MFFGVDLVENSRNLGFSLGVREGFWRNFLPIWLFEHLYWFFILHFRGGFFPPRLRLGLILSV